MSIKVTKLSSQGQITIPKAFIEQLGLVKGQLLDIILANNKIIICRKDNPLDEFVGVMNKKNKMTSEELLKIRGELAE